MRIEILGQWLNRIGIILNFIAGLLITPEIFGAERIKKFECKLENALVLSSAKIDNLIGRMRQLKVGSQLGVSNQRWFGIIQIGFIVSAVISIIIYFVIFK